MNMNREQVSIVTYNRHGKYLLFSFMQVLRDLNFEVLLSIEKNILSSMYILCKVNFILKQYIDSIECVVEFLRHAPMS